MLPLSTRWPLVFLAGTFLGAGALRAAEATDAKAGDVVKVRFAPDAEGVPDRAANPQSTVVGTLAEIETDALVVAGPAGRVRLPRAAIEDLQVKRGRSRGRAALIGAGVGAAVGLVVGGVATSRCRGEAFCGMEMFLPVLTVPAGALIGALAGGQRWVAAEVPRVAFSLGPARGGLRVAATLSF